MSYILEALKKSQAERQLGSAPGLHAVPVGAPMREAAAVRRRPLAIVLCAIAVAAALATVAWHFKSSDKKTAAPPPAAAHVAGPAPAAPAPKGPAHAPAAPTPAAVAMVAVTAAPAPPPLAVVPPSAPMEKPPIARAAPAPRPVPVPVPVKAVAPPAPPPAVDEEEKLQTLRQLPEPIQRSVPPLVFGGYMYSSNPADRLVLIDKMLRHEGEEVAPGLVLEKLLPKGAVMNYRGYRYRVPF
jgi:general secretion pathway protein B